MAFTPSFSCAHAVQTARADTALLLRRAPSPEGAAAARVPPGALLFVCHKNLKKLKSPGNMLKNHRRPV